MDWLTKKEIDPEAFCHTQNVTYEHPVNDPAHFTYCPVPEKGFDALAFMAIAILVAALQKGKMSALVVFAMGGIFQVLTFLVNMGPLANGLNLWLGISPAELFMYGFLPPLLFDSAVRVEMYVFKKMLGKVLTMAFLVVLACTAQMVPLLLYVFRLSASGWSWVQAALFIAIVASTDAVTVNALVKSAGGPEEMTILLEGESLFNDASSLTLFSVFFALSEEVHASSPPVLPTLKLVLQNLVILGLGGAVFGYIIGYLTRKLIGWMQARGAKPFQELAIVFAMAYIAYYGGQAILQCSGVVAVVVYGLYGSSKGKWELSTKAISSGAFDGFLGTITFGINGIIFFYAGASSVNFVWRSLDVLGNRGLIYHLAVLLGIYVGMFVTRYLSIAFFNVFFTWMGIGLPRETVLFATVSGLRGALSLIMVQVVIQDQARANNNNKHAHEIDAVTAQLVLYTAGFVLLTLIINAPLMPWFMKVTGLTKVSRASKVVRDKARRALVRFTKGAIHDLKDDEDEILRGVNWKHVEQYTDLTHELQSWKLTLPSDKQPGAPSRKTSMHPVHRQLQVNSQQASLEEPLINSTDVEQGVQQPSRKASTHDFDGDTPLLLEKDEDAQQPPPADFLQSIGNMDDDVYAGGACPYAFPTNMDASTAPAMGSSHNTVGVLLPAVKLGPSATSNGCMTPSFFAANKEIPVMLPANASTMQRSAPEMSSRRTMVHRAVSATNLLSRGNTQISFSTLDEDWRLEFQAEARMRLINGFKRFAHSKRDEGLLSAKGLRMLDYACDVAIDHSDERLNIWSGLENEIVGRVWVKFLAHTHVVVRRCKYFLMRFKFAKLSGLLFLLNVWSGYIGTQLSEKLLLACETAMGYFLALSYTPFAQWLADTNNQDYRDLQSEVKAEAARVWQFIVDREVEAPERFQAIQSYRAAMAVMHQQLGFVEELYMSGMIDEAEKEIMEHPIEKRIVNLERNGATWQSPRTREILAALPFLENVPAHVVDAFLQNGELRNYTNGEVIFTPLHIAANNGGFYCVLHGMVKGYSKSGDKVQEFFLGSGRVFGLMSSLTGDGLPGSAGIIAAGNALGRGPVLFYVPTARLRALLARADEGDPAYIQLEVDLYRVAACYTLERLKAQLISASTRAYLQLLEATEAAEAAAYKEEDEQPVIPKPARSKSRKIKAHDIDEDHTDDEMDDFQNSTPFAAEIPPLMPESPATPFAKPNKQLQGTAKQLALHLVQSVREGICDSELVHAVKGQKLPLRRHMVLLKGTMLSQRLALPAAAGGSTSLGWQTAGDASADTQHMQFQGPTIIPSLLSCPQARSTLNVQPLPLVFQALTDCLLLLCGPLKTGPTQEPVDLTKSFTDDMLGVAGGATIIEGGTVLTRKHEHRPLLPLASNAMALYAPEALQDIALPP